MNSLVKLNVNNDCYLYERPTSSADGERMVCKLGKSFLFEDVHECESPVILIKRAPTVYIQNGIPPFPQYSPSGQLSEIGSREIGCAMNSTRTTARKLSRHA